MRRYGIVILAFAVQLAACGGAAVPDEVVAAEAAWLCDVPRYTFGAPADIEAELDALLDAAGISRDAYDEFKIRLDDDRELRRRVAESFATTCGED